LNDFWSYSRDFTSDFRDFTLEFTVFKPDVRYLWSDYRIAGIPGISGWISRILGRINFRTFVHQISKVVEPSVLVLLVSFA